MKVYRGCMFSIFGLVIGAFSLLFSRSFGILGLFLPPALFGFGYLLVETIIVELYYSGQDSNRHY